MASELKRNSVTRIDHTPNFRTLTEGGRVFNRLADACAEFCDNSIQATRHNEVGANRTIVISLRLDKADNSYFSIIDNGIGMDEKGLQEFGTYALNQESRGNRADSSSFISKFGVGAKEAGFYIGNKIHVITSPKGSFDVKEMKMDKDGYIQREQQGFSVF